MKTELLGAIVSTVCTCGITKFILTPATVELLNLLPEKSESLNLYTPARVELLYLLPAEGELLNLLPVNVELPNLSLAL